RYGRTSQGWGPAERQSFSTTTVWITGLRSQWVWPRPHVSSISRASPDRQICVAPSLTPISTSLRTWIIRRRSGIGMVWLGWRPGARPPATRAPPSQHAVAVPAPAPTPGPWEAAPRRRGGGDPRHDRQSSYWVVVLPFAVKA